VHDVEVEVFKPVPDPPENAGMRIAWHLTLHMKSESQPRQDKYQSSVATEPDASRSRKDILKFGAIELYLRAKHTRYTE